MFQIKICGIHREQKFLKSSFFVFVYLQALISSVDWVLILNILWLRGFSLREIFKDGILKLKFIGIPWFFYSLPNNLFNIILLQESRPPADTCKEADAILSPLHPWACSIHLQPSSTSWPPATPESGLSWNYCLQVSDFYHLAAPYVRLYRKHAVIVRWAMFKNPLMVAY